MLDKLEILNMAQGMATHAAARQSVLARNIANADTPGYRAQDVASFADSFQKTDDFTPRVSRAGHLPDGQISGEIETYLASGDSAPNGNTVSLETEMMKAVETRNQHDMALTIYKTTLGILRTSLGR